LDNTLKQLCTNLIARAQTDVKNGRKTPRYLSPFYSIKPQSPLSENQIALFIWCNNVRSQKSCVGTHKKFVRIPPHSPKEAILGGAFLKVYLIGLPVDF